MGEVSTIGLDLAANVFRVHGADALTSWQRAILDLGARVAWGRVQVGDQRSCDQGWHRNGAQDAQTAGEVYLQSATISP